jgi:hypothetical protein
MVSLVMLAWILSAFNLAEVGRALKAANYFYLLPVAVLVFLSFSLRALRWGKLFTNTHVPHWSSLFQGLMIGYLANNVLPAHAGEFVRVFVLSQRKGLAKSTVLATVVVERVADLIVTLVLLAVVLLFFPFPAWLGPAGFIVGAVSLVALVFLTLFNVIGERLMMRLVGLLEFFPKTLLARIEAMGRGFLVGVSGLRHHRRALQFLGYSALIWLTEVAITFLIVQAFHLSVSVGGSLFIMLAIALGTVIPSSPGYIGTYEFFATSALALLGVTGGGALSFALVLHAVTFLGASFLGAVCLVQTGVGLTRVFAPLPLEKGEDIQWRQFCIPNRPK